MDQKQLFKNRCMKIVNRIKPRYPSLSDKEIKLHLWNLWQGSMMSLKLFGHRIVVDYSKWKDATDKELTGTLAHEMVHQEYMATTSYSQLIYNLFMYQFSKKYRKKFEQRTDLETIKKGFGKELLISANYRLKFGEDYVKFMKQYYLMPNEIKSYMKKLK